MKITHAKVIVCCPGRNFVTLKIETYEGLTGIGDATLNGREPAVAACLTEHVIPCLIGRVVQDPLAAALAAQLVRLQAAAAFTEGVASFLSFAPVLGELGGEVRSSVRSPGN